MPAFSEGDGHMPPARTTTVHLSPPGATKKLAIGSGWQALRRVAAIGAIVGASLAPVMLAGPPTAAATEPSSSAVHGEVHLLVWSVDSDGPDFQAVLSGAIGDFGPAVTVLPDGEVDPEHTSEMRLELRHGTFRLYIDGIASKFRAQVSHEPVYAATCSDYVDVTADVPVVPGSGTGSYRGIRGNFSLSLTGNEDQLSPPCRAGFARQILVLTGSGTVSS